MSNSNVRSETKRSGGRRPERSIAELRTFEFGIASYQYKTFLWTIPSTYVTFYTVILYYNLNIAASLYYNLKVAVLLYYNLKIATSLFI